MPIDKPAFGHTMQLTKSSQLRTLRELRQEHNGHDEVRQRNVGVYLNSTTNVKKYSDKYRIKNVGELRTLLTKQTD